MKRRESDLSLLRQRLADSLVAQALGRCPILRQDTQRDLDRLRPEGYWDDIDYQDQSLMGEWRSGRHLARMFRMATVRQLPEGAAGDRFAEGALKALDFWLERDFRNPNWWWNEIGVPRGVGEVLVLMQDMLTPNQLKAGLKIMDRNDWSAHTGQNLVWGVAIQILRGCLANSCETVDEGVARLAWEIRVARPGKEGIQADHSFHQHGAVLYSGGYGLCFACDCAALAAVTRGTRWALQPNTVATLSAFLLDGQQWMVRGQTFDYSAVGREISRRGKAAIGLDQACADMERVDPARCTELAAFRRRLRGHAKPTDALAGNRHFWKSDLMTHHRPAYYASVRMFSDRLDSTDWICGGEGKKIAFPGGRGHVPVSHWQRIPRHFPGLGLAARARNNRRISGRPTRARIGADPLDAPVRRRRF